MELSRCPFADELPASGQSRVPGKLEDNNEETRRKLFLRDELINDGNWWGGHLFQTSQLNLVMAIRKRQLEN